MRIADIVASALSSSLGPVVERILWRIAGACAAIIFALAALYQLTVAGTIALEVRYGALEARLFVGAAYAFAAALCILTLWFNRSRKTRSRSEADALLNAPRTAQIAMLMEAATAGFVAGKGTAKSAR
jgi:hypothetical protein